MKTIPFLFALAFCVQGIQNYNILGVFPFNGRSHFVMFERLLKGLAAKGHKVDVVSHFPQQRPIPRYNDLSVDGTIPSLLNNLSVPFIRGKSLISMMDFIMGPGGYRLCEVLFNTTVLRDLKNTSKKYDLLLTELFSTDCMLGFAHIFKIPIVAMTSSVNLPWASDRLGNPDNPAYIPTFFVPYASKMSFLERLYNTITLTTAKINYNLVWMDETNKLARNFFGPDLPDLRDLARQTSLLFVNSHVSLNSARPFVPNTIEVGGLHIADPKPLPKHLENIVRNSTNGVVYLSIGSMLQTESFAPDKLQAMFDAFEELQYTVLWKADVKKFPAHLTIPSNVHFEKWMPQLDVLCHPNVKLFVSHGGLMGIQEACYCGIPMLNIPFFADQFLNVKNSQELGVSIQVDYENITKEHLLEALKRITQDPGFKNKAEKVSSKFRDRPHTPLETAIFWTEYVIRHNGAPELRSTGADLLWYQYYLVDVFLVFIGAVAFVLYLIHVLVAVTIYFLSNGNLVKEKNC